MNVVFAPRARTDLRRLDPQVARPRAEDGFLDALKYYSPRVHGAAFVMPRYMSG